MASEENYCSSAYPTNNVILRALRANSTVLSLDNSKLQLLPPALGRLTSLTTFSAKNNKLDDNGLSQVLQSLEKLRSLNLGGNNLSDLPVCLLSFHYLTYLHLFNNHITQLNEKILGTLQEVAFFNLNGNYINELPPSIIKLTNLQTLCISNNKLTHLPRELCQLPFLTELHLEGNLLEKLPSNIGQLRSLEKLYLQKNKLEYISPSIGKCKRLKILDVSCNQIPIFPVELSDLKLHELYCELNPFLPLVPVPSDQQEEVLSLKELVSRYLVKILENDSQLEAIVDATPELKHSLYQVGKCAVCKGPFINSWLDCVHFVEAKKLFPLKTPSGIIPLRVVLCSYKCFNAEEHSYYGIATPPVRTGIKNTK